MPAEEITVEFAGDLSLQLMMTYRSLHYLFNKFLDNAELAQHYQLLFILITARNVGYINYSSMCVYSSVEGGYLPCVVCY